MGLVDDFLDNVVGGNVPSAPKPEPPAPVATPSAPPVVAAADGYELAVAFVLRMEGGYVNDPSDPGGETKYGISKRSYPNVNIAGLSVDDAKAIYYRDYWVPAQCALKPAPLGLMLFDAVVNMGLGVEPALTVAPFTLDDVTARRLLKYVTYAKFAIYGTSWVRRTLAAYKLALTLAGAPSIGQGATTAPKGTSQ